MRFWKNSTIVLKVFSFVFIIYSMLSIAPKETQTYKGLFVNAESGLYLRSKPSVKGNKLGLVPYGEEVVLLKGSGIIEKIDGKQGEWVFVRWQKKEGWVFNAYLIEQFKYWEKYCAFDRLQSFLEAYPIEWSYLQNEIMSDNLAREGYCNNRGARSHPIGEKYALIRSYYGSDDTMVVMNGEFHNLNLPNVAKKLPVKEIKHFNIDGENEGQSTFTFLENGFYIEERDWEPCLSELLNSPFYYQYGHYEFINTNKIKLCKKDYLFTCKKKSYDGNIDFISAPDGCMTIEKSSIETGRWYNPLSKQAYYEEIKR